MAPSLIRLIYFAPSLRSNHFLHQNQSVRHAIGELLRRIALLAALVEIAGSHVNAAVPRVQPDVLQLLEDPLAHIGGAGKGECHFSRIGGVSAGNLHVVVRENVANHLIHGELRSIGAWKSTLSGRTAWLPAFDSEESGDSLKTSNSREKPPVEFYDAERTREIQCYLQYYSYCLIPSGEGENYDVTHITPVLRYLYRITGTFHNSRFRLFLLFDYRQLI